MILAERLTPQEFGIQLAALGITSAGEILPVGDQMRLPQGATPKDWHIEDFIAQRTGDRVELVGTCVIHYTDASNNVGYSRVPIAYAEWGRIESTF